MEIVFYPLDVTYRIVNGKAVIYMYGKTKDNLQLCIKDTNFNPYFYVQPKRDTPHGQLVSQLGSMAVPFNGGIAEVASVMPTEKNLLGKTINLVKVFTKLPKHVPVIQSTVRKHPYVENTFEYDILYAKRYLMDKGIIPLLSLNVSGDFVEERSKVPVFEASRIEPVSEEGMPNLKILSFDIETYNPTGKDVNTSHPILMIAFYGVSDGKEFRKVITWKQFNTMHDYIEFVDSELALIQRFKEVIEQFKPDMLTGYFTDGFDLPYIIARAKKYRIALDLGSDYSVIDSDRSDSVSITGIVHIDLFKFIRNVVGRTLEVDDYSLGSVASELLNEHKLNVEIEKLAYKWDNSPQELEIYCSYNLQDALIAHKLCEKLLPNISELAKIVGLPLFDINRMSFSRLVESYVMSQCRLYNQLVPNRPDHNEVKLRQSRTFEGAFVYQPTAGLYDNVVVFDFRSLYPSIITSHNISPDTLNCSCCSDQVPGSSYRFCQKNKGFLSSVLENVIVRRMRVKELMRASSEPLLEARGNALKLLANSFYGYLGFAPARWYCFECATSVTAYGRHHIHEVIDKLNQSGFSVIYSDTDSVFVLLKDKPLEKVLDLVKQFNENLPGLMELDYEGFYPSAIFVSAKAGDYGAKKKYAMLDHKGRFKIRGFEIVRRNWSAVSKDVQEKVLNFILREKNVEAAFAYVENVVSDLHAHKIPLAKVIIHTQLQKPIEAYENVGPHVAAAMRLSSNGEKVSAGMSISYVVASGKGIVRDRVKLPHEVQDGDYDADYYVDNQVIPAVDRIFAVFDIDVKKRIQNRNQSTLSKFF